MECKNHTFGTQKPYFGTQKPYFGNAKTILWELKNGSIRYRIELYDKTNVAFQHILGAVNFVFSQEMASIIQEKPLRRLEIQPSIAQKQ